MMFAVMLAYALKPQVPAEEEQAYEALPRSRFVRRLQRLQHLRMVRLRPQTFTRRNAAL